MSEFSYETHPKIEILLTFSFNSRWNTRLQTVQTKLQEVVDLQNQNLVHRKNIRINRQPVARSRRTRIVVTVRLTRTWTGMLHLVLSKSSRCGLTSQRLQGRPLRVRSTTLDLIGICWARLRRPLMHGWIRVIVSLYALSICCAVIIVVTPP